MCLVELDAAFYQYLLEKQFLPLLNVAQCFGFLPYPFDFQRQAEVKNIVLQKMLTILNRTFGLAMIGTVLTCCVSLYVCYPSYMYEEDYPPVLNIAYHLENWLKIVTVLVAVLRPQTSTAYFRETVNSLVQIMVQYDQGWRIERKLASVASVSKRLSVVFLLDDFTIATGLYFIVEGAPATLINLCYIPPFIAIVINVLHYYALFGTISGIVSCSNDTLYGITVEGKKDRQRSCSERRRKSNKVENDIATIDKLVRLHKALLHLTWKTNAHYGVLLLIIMLYSFVQISVILAELYFDNYDLPLVFVGICLTHAAVYFMFFLIIAHANHAIIMENERTLLLLLDINCIWNSELNGMVDYYFMQVSNLRDTHQACGMIKLDMQLVPNVVAVITSILFILMQFSDADQNQDIETLYRLDNIYNISVET
uniref:Gustatory receptor n=1 Tax=Anopheles coluzzii TaxID=1518534 RepID=A0A6E8VSA7_ANOCL